jgi:hypothetical protein
MTAPMAAHHRPVVSRIVTQEGPRYRLTCTCGREWDASCWRQLAERDRDEHVRELAALVPAAERCRDRRAHRMQAWERCPLCAGQLALFEGDL